MDTFRGHFGGHDIRNTLDKPVQWTGVRIDEHVIGDVSLLGQYGQWTVPGEIEGAARGYWDEWPPHLTDEPDELEMVPLEFPVTIEPGHFLNVVVGFEADTSKGDVHIPYLIYDYEVDGKPYQLVDPMGWRVTHKQETCDIMPEIFTTYEG